MSNPANNKELQHQESTDSLESSDDGKKRVCFDEVHVMEFPVTMGDNPHCEGAPLTLEWVPLRSTSCDIDLYEYTRGPQRRTRKQLSVPCDVRAAFLLSQGFDVTQIIQCAEEGRKIREERTLNAQTTKLERFHAAIHAVRSPFRRKGSDRTLMKQTTAAAKSA